MKLQVLFAKFWPTTTAKYFTPGGLFKAFISTFTSLQNLNEIASVFAKIWPTESLYFCCNKEHLDIF